MSIAMLAGLGVSLLTAGSCGDDSSSSSSDSGAGQPTPPLWNDQSTTATGGTGDTPLLWNDPNTAGILFGIIDPTDVRTYTYPDIYILGNKHPLMVDIIQRDFPVIFNQENRLTEILIEWRIQEYERAIGMRRTDPGFPRAAFIAEYIDLRRNARAHAKHYAVWHTTVAPFPVVNEEGDNVLTPASPCPPPPCTHIQVSPANVAVAWVSPTGRLIKSFIDCDQAGQLVAAGTTLGIPDRVFTQWVTNNTPFMLRTVWTHLGVGYWSGTGSSLLHYYNGIWATNPRALVVTPAIPIIFF
jgi:hypothetical protein